MPYDDRLRFGSYTHPLVDRQFTFQFDTLSRKASKKHSIDEIPQSDLAIVQDFGMESIQFPMTIYFSGPDYDLTADQFFAALSQKGPGTISHPRWGNVRALPVSFSQDEEFVDSLGRAVFDVQWVYAADVPYLTTKVETQATIAATSAAARSDALTTFDASFGSPALRAALDTKQSIRSTLRTLSTSMTKLTGSIATLSQIVNAEISAILRDLDTLILAPVTLGESLQRAITTAASSSDLTIDAKVNAYRDFSTSLGLIRPKSTTEAATLGIMAHATATALADSSTSGTLNSRAEAIQARDTIAQTSSQILSMIEAWEAQTGYTMRPDDVSNLVLVTSQASALLLESSFSLRAERIITTEGETTPLDLIYRFYGSIDALDEFCEQNHLNGNQTLVISPGTEIRYYVG